MANIFSITCSTIYVCATGKGFYIEKHLRGALITRSVIGLIGLTAFTLGAVLAPLSVQLSVGNMAPFFASIVAYLTVGEQMARLEILAMFVSFGGVILVALG